MGEKNEENEDLGRDLSSVWIQAEDIKHHSKYLGTGGRGKTRSLVTGKEDASQGPYTPSPADVVSFGIEPVSYLATFSKESTHYQSCQALLTKIMWDIEAKLGEFSTLMRVPPKRSEEIDFNVMLSSVEDISWLHHLKGKRFEEQIRLVTAHLEND